MPLHIVRNDITKMQVDAIVNAAKNSLLGGSGVDGAIHRAAGPGLLAECRTLGGCATGRAKITAGYSLPAKYVIHTVGPVWQGGDNNEKRLLESCYTSSLSLALSHKCESVAFPLISAGVYGYPKDAALRVAVDTVTRWLADNEMDVYIVIFDSDVYATGRKMYRNIREYIDDRYADARADSAREKRRRRALASMAQKEYGTVFSSSAGSLYCKEKSFYDMEEDSFEDVLLRPKKTQSLEEYISAADTGFSQALLDLIKKKGMKESRCYKKANISRKVFSKIRNDPAYHPSKNTAIAFAVALQLSIEETARLLKKAGYALSPADKSDLVVEYFIINGIYDIIEINNALFDFDLPLLTL